jgi:hypothetical protein
LLLTNADWKLGEAEVNGEQADTCEVDIKIVDDWQDNIECSIGSDDENLLGTSL